jgi:hypothetical protein
VQLALHCCSLCKILNPHIPNHAGSRLATRLPLLNSSCRVCCCGLTTSLTTSRVYFSACSPLGEKEVSCGIRNVKSAYGLGVVQTLHYFHQAELIVHFRIIPLRGIRARLSKKLEMGIQEIEDENIPFPTHQIPRPSSHNPTRENTHETEQEIRNGNTRD